MSSKKRVLFLCTGNYYRSRFAEILFNHHAAKLGLPWVADSRALAIERGACNIGPISTYTLAALGERNIRCDTVSRMPSGCAIADFESSDLVIALKEAEHRGYMRSKFPAWEDRITYWHVHDLDMATPAEAIVMIERHVAELVEELREQR